MISVGISQRALPLTEFGERRDALDRRWHRFLHACGLVAIPLPNETEIALDTVSNTNCSGLVFSGGDDLVKYGGEANGRDETEQVLLAWAVSNKKPVIGVCRGMQIIIDLYGAHLHKVDNHVGCYHEIRTINGLRRVNSFHRWAATEVDKPLIVTATTGNVIEAIQHLDMPLFGMMWHPEREPIIDPIDLEFFKRIFGG